MTLRPYNRQAAVAYAHRWAYGRNPRFYDYEDIGGDCTNFASQCLFAGTGVMNYTPTFGWYYITGNDKAPAWTGVPYFFNFMTRQQVSPGPVGIEAPPELLLPGDFVQLRFSNDRYGHTPVIVETGDPPSVSNILVAAHSQDADYRPLDSYFYQEIRFIHIQGFYPQGVWQSSNSPQLQKEKRSSAWETLLTPTVGGF